MDRRHAMLALTGAAVPFILRPRQAAAQSGSPLDAGSYTQQTLQVGTLAKTLSQLALQQSPSAPVHGFAQSEILEQTAVAQALTNDFNPPPAPLSSEQQQIVSTLQSLSGVQFDNAYIVAQIQGHQQLLALQQGYLQVDSNPASDLVHTALIASAFIETHLLLLSDLGATGHL